MSLSFTFSACAGDADFEAQFSNEGLKPEAYIPGDVGMVLSYTLRDENQRQALGALQDKMGGNDLSETFAETFNDRFSEAGLDYEKDLMPAFGESFRWVYAARPIDEETEIFSVTTLENPDQIIEAFDLLAEAGSLEKKILSERDVYVSEKDQFYVTIFDDLLFMASDPANLVTMVDQSEEDSLWAQESYQEALVGFGEEFILYGILFPEHYSENVSLMSGLSIANVPAVIDYQSLVLRADTVGLRFEIDVHADKERAKEVGFSFDAVPRSEPYLYEEVPSEKLMAYLESYGLKQTLSEASKFEDGEDPLEQLRTSFRNYFGMDFDEEFMSFFDKAYALALHENVESLIPGVSILIDVSSDKNSAEALVNKLDGQLSGLIAIFAQSLPNAVVKDTVNIKGVSFDRVVLDLSSIPRTEDSPIPSIITTVPIQLIYGLYENRLLLSTASIWEEELDSIAESTLYKDLNAQMEGADQGLILLDADGLSSFVGTLRSLREQLSLEVSDQTLKMEAFLGNFYGAIARSQTDAYSSQFTGYLMLAE